MCDFKAGLLLCQLLWFYHIGDKWTISDRCVTHSINIDRAQGVNSMLTGIIVAGDDVKDAGSYLRLHVA